MDHPEICGKHKFNDARTLTKDAIDRQTQLRNACDVTDLTIMAGLFERWLTLTQDYELTKV